MIPYTAESYKLLHDGARALARVEKNGILIDTGYLLGAMDSTLAEIGEKEEALKDSDEGKTWRKTFRSKTNYGSREQLGKILFDVLDFDCPNKTATGRYKTDMDTLSTVDSPLAKLFVEIERLKKARNTFLMGILKEVADDGRLHPFFNLHTVMTYRSSSDSPNFQNFPSRDPVMMRLIRQSFIASPGWVLVEIDYSGVEVRIAACYHKDPRMIGYINDPTKDMHRDMAMECFALPEKEITKQIRYCGKNMFVFPQFYGSYWLDCAFNLWTAAQDPSLKTASGKEVRKHLRKKGIKTLGEQNRKDPNPQKGTFEYHIQQVEKAFWNKRFKIYSQWKKDWYADYSKKGWFDTLTGFVCQGYMRRNEVINYPVQGSAFHCLLWSLCRLVLGRIRKAGLRAKVVGQVHDSIVAEVPIEELDEFLALANKTMTTDLRNHWDWINVPLEIEAEVAPVGGSWADKKDREIPS